jgi:hypothetical protein
MIEIMLEISKYVPVNEQEVMDPVKKRQLQEIKYILFYLEGIILQERAEMAIELKQNSTTI